MAEFIKTIGTQETQFAVGLGGPTFRNNSGLMEVRTSDLSALARLAGAAPVEEDDFATKYYVDSSNGIIRVDDQVDTSGSIPNNTGAVRYLVVTEPGSGANAGALLYDNGSGTGTMAILAPANRTISVGTALSGNTITFGADTLNLFDVEGGSWIEVGNLGSVTGAVRAIRFTINNAASQDSTEQIPANALVISARLGVTTPFSGGATISIGDTSTADLIMATGDNLPQTANGYNVPQDTIWGGSDSVVRVTITGSPAAGAGVVTVLYSVANS